MKEARDSSSTQMHDFTTEHYGELLRLAKASYEFAGYRERIPAQRFVLWRHDCDFSLNRSLRLAQIEAGESVKATYFLNPHSEFYNLLEKGQAELVKQILGLGHDIGLHFDAAYYGIQSENELDGAISREARWIREWFGVDPAAVSFHNPLELLLSCERDTYGGLANCYSGQLKKSVPYISDSNGTWRFRRLRDVLEAAREPSLQVLTHPDWWQETAMHPRQRVFRSCYGRAKATMSLYDEFVEGHGRDNHAGPAGDLRFLKGLDPTRYEFLDFLWNSRLLSTLFIELFRLHERQINRICKAVFRKDWNVPARALNAFFDDPSLAIEGTELFQVVFGESVMGAIGDPGTEQTEWVTVCNQLIHGRGHITPERLEDGCLYLCRIIERAAKWGQAQANIRYDGLAQLDEIGIATEHTGDSYNRERLVKGQGNGPEVPQKWTNLLARVSKFRIGATTTSA